jgi:hypothetical protein
MQNDLIREIANAIVSESLLKNWHFWIMMLLISVVSTAIGGFLLSYSKRRGEALATKADLADILRQLEQTTRVSEEVKANVSHSNWVQREWLSIRRLKLEELLSTAYALDQWLELQKQRWVFGETSAGDETPPQKLRSIGTLYFPEMKDETQGVWQAFVNCQLFILKVGRPAAIAKLQLNVVAQKAALEAFSQGWSEHYVPTRSALAALEKRAAQLMQEIAAAG